MGQYEYLFAKEHSISVNAATGGAVLGAVFSVIKYGSAIISQDAPAVVIAEVVIPAAVLGGLAGLVGGAVCGLAIEAYNDAGKDNMIVTGVAANIEHNDL